MYSWSKYAYNEDEIDFFYYNQISPVLDLEDDAAHVLWGGDWHTPDTFCFSIFNTETIHEYVENYNATGINGVLITGKGNYSSSVLFLPCGGYLDNNTRYRVNTQGLYWTRSIYCDDDRGNPYLLFDDADFYIDDLGMRWDGYLIRPVLVVQE